MSDNATQAARRPVVIVRTGRDTIRALFASGEQRELQMRGAVCWPIPPSVGASEPRGFIVLAGRDLATGKTHVVEEAEFIHIKHTLDDDGRISSVGLASWLNMVWQAWGAAHFWWHQDTHANWMYRQQVNECDLIQPKPRWVELYWNDNSLAEGALWSMIASEQLDLLDDSRAYAALNEWRARPGMEATREAAVWALCVLSTGLMQHPLRHPPSPLSGSW